jgi:hypothetical protein
MSMQPKTRFWLNGLIAPHQAKNEKTGSATVVKSKTQTLIVVKSSPIYREGFDKHAADPVPVLVSAELVNWSGPGTPAAAWK